MYIEIINQQIDQKKKELNEKEKENKKIESEIAEHEEKLKERESDYQKQLKNSTKAGYWESYLVSTLLLAGLFLYGYFVDPSWTLYARFAEFCDNSLAYMLIALWFADSIVALFTWLPVTLIKQLILRKKKKETDELKAQTQKALESDKKKLSALKNKHGKLQNEISDDAKVIDRLREFLPIINDFETAFEMAKNPAILANELGRIYHLLKTSTEAAKKCGEEFEKVAELMDAEFVKFKEVLENFEDADSQAAFCQILLTEDIPFALGLLQRSVDKNSEAGKEAMKIILGMCEKNIYDSKYGDAITFLEPLKDAGNEEAKLLWRKAWDFRKEEQLAEKRRQAELEAEEEHRRRLYLMEQEEQRRREEERRREEFYDDVGFTIDVTDM